MMRYQRPISHRHSTGDLYSSTDSLIDRFLSLDRRGDGSKVAQWGEVETWDSDHSVWYFQNHGDFSRGRLGGGGGRDTRDDLPGRGFGPGLGQRVKPGNY